MKTTVISLGGSLIVPKDINVSFLKKFRKIILKKIKKNKIALICGGGNINRKYIDAAQQIVPLEKDDLDWLGIHVTRLNAHLVKTIFKGIAYERVIKNPTEKIPKNQKLVIAGGWKPGCSTDYDAVLLAQNLGAKMVINMTNIDYVYDKDPKKFKDAKPIKELSWKKYRKSIPSAWSPKLNTPFDPVASKLAQQLMMTVFIINGNNLKNFDNLLNSKDFNGTVIK